MSILRAVIILLLVPTLSWGQNCITEAGKPIVNVTDADIVGATTWSASNIYVLNGFVFVESGETLTIDPGTIVKAMPGAGASASALIVARGGKIFANGEANCPIIFTGVSDNVDDPNDIPIGTNGLWGGVIILGNAQINTALGVGQIEGIPPAEVRGAYGGSDDADNSGVFKYVSIRHGGTQIGAGNEINGLTMGAVGSGTEIHHVEVFNNLDDGFEFFGGTVNTSYMVSAFNGDDSFDYDEGFRGNGQFWFSLNAATFGDRAGEHDGGTVPEDGTPLAIPHIKNATYIGSGVNALTANRGFAIRDNAGGKYFNSIFTDFADRALTVEDLVSGADSRQRLETGDLDFRGNLWWGFGAAVDQVGFTDTASYVTDTYVLDILFRDSAKYNLTRNPGIVGISRSRDGGLDPRARFCPTWTDNLAAWGNFSDPFFVDSKWVGAFNPKDSLWTDNWTYLWELGYTSNAPVPGVLWDENNGKPTVTVTDADIVGTRTLTQDTVYILSGFVFVENGETLNIEGGTIIKALPGAGASASALIVAQGGTINAVGKPWWPIVFTSVTDNVPDPNDIPLGTNGLWGGVIILGNAQINTALGVGQIEGIPPSEIRGAYGGTNDADNSGVFKYVSIRHGGTQIGAGNEINGLTLGAVGSGTEINHVEVFNNLDDGFEFFGGTVNTSYMVSAFNGDDSFDYDEGFRGKGQFWFSLNDAAFGDRAGEHDGGTVPEDGTPLAIPVIKNATYIGSGVNALTANRGFAIRDNAGGKYFNSIFTDFADRALTVEDLVSGADSRERLEVGDLEFECNIWWGFGAAVDQVAFTDTASYVTDSYVLDILFRDASKNNFVTNPSLVGISRTPDNGLDPRSTICPNWTTSNPDASNAFFTDVLFTGAFSPDSALWTDDWTHLWQREFTSHAAAPGFDGGVCTPAGCCLVPGDFNDDASFNIADVTSGIARIFSGGPAPICQDQADSNGDNTFNIADVTYGIARIFSGGAAPICGNTGS